MAFDGRLLGGISVLVAVVETGNFVRAAQALGLTQSGVSRAVARLEARVGVRLFDRNPRSVTLTEEGRRFHAQVTPLLSGLEDARSDLRQPRLSGAPRRAAYAARLDASRMSLVPRSADRPPLPMGVSSGQRDHRDRCHRPSHDGRSISGGCRLHCRPRRVSEP